MKIERQTDESLQLLADAVKPHRVAMLVLRDDGADAALGGRPMTPLEIDAAGAIWFMASRKALAPRDGGVSAALMFADPADSDYVSVSGRLDWVDDAARKKDLWSAYARPWFSGPDDPDLVLLKVRPTRAEIWDGPDSRVGRVLAMAASIAAGHEVGLGDKDVVEPGRRPG